MSKRGLQTSFFVTNCGHQWFAAIMTWLLFLTVVSLTSNFQETAPFDARTGQHVEGLSLTYPVWGALIEPFAAIGQILAGAPDMRMAVISMSLWFLCIPFLFAMVRHMQGHLHQSYREHYLRASRLSAFFAAGFVLYLAFIITVPMPTWALQDRDASDVPADLHTHTFFSHDGLVSPQDNFLHHRDVGDQVVVFSDHGPLPHHYGMNNVISGIELGIVAGDLHIIGIGVDPDKFDPVPLYGLPDLEVLAYQIHDVHNGAVIAMSEHLRPEDVRTLVELGVDGFELFNQGYTPPDQALRNALLQAQRESGIALVADSDWHGWTTLNQQWTLFRQQHASSPVKAVIESIRDHHGASVFPVTAHHPGQVSLFHNLFSPLFEAYRYACELDHLRLFSWWIWGALLLVAVRYFEARRINPARGLTTITLILVGTAMFTASFYHLDSWSTFQDVNSFGRDLFLLILCISMLCLAAAHRLWGQRHRLPSSCHVQDFSSGLPATAPA